MMVNHTFYEIPPLKSTFGYNMHRKVKKRAN
ncbi:hypothetical protein Runsl_1591 [Runella slithyformis DSM 19594]|uniref:Uncharacterized protein n=1 Tax=Runella slithyformis (strain ATCC 29530 / DSM 19594 / LMG 11500 / NCIMB 11436 / LSU 4) TaxID=761193 RepID=A0A7U3ZIU3_RUNSL|nr:hypothetical protein Runsl_1591 [Runella slithyformis DSM 19594]